MKALTLYFAILLLNISAYAQNPGDLNIDFSEDGFYFENWVDISTRAYGIEVLSDGNIIIAGEIGTSFPTSDIFATKLDEQGKHVSFGNQLRGFVYDFCDYEAATSIAILPDNAIFIAGVYMKVFMQYLPFVIKLDSGGDPDEDFADNGVYFDESIPIMPNKIKIYSHDESFSLILAGHASGIVARLMMLNAEGTIETTFGTDGMIEVDEHYGIFTDLFIDSENSLLYACGYYNDGGAFVAKYNLPDGSPVAGFGVDGVLSFTPDMGYNASFDAMVVDIGENTITLFGSYPAMIDDNDIFAYRLHADNGSDDESFGIDGISTLRVAGSDESIRSATMQSDGKYYFGGYTNYYGTKDFFIGRVNHDGFADLTFGTKGLVVTDMGFNDQIFDISLNANESILYAAGYSDNAGENAQAIAAYHTGYEIEPDPDPDLVKFITEENLNSIDVFPNPSSGIISIETDLTGTHIVQVFDLAGKELLNKSYSGESIELNLEFLQPSIYFIHVMLPDGRTSTGNFIIR